MNGGLVGRPVMRVNGRAKVAVAARYPVDDSVPDALVELFGVVGRCAMDDGLAGRPVARVDGRIEVAGAARFPVDTPVPGALVELCGGVGGVR